MNKVNAKRKMKWNKNVHEEWRALCCAVVYAKRSVAWSRLSARVIFAYHKHIHTNSFNFITTKTDERIELWTLNAAQYNAMFVHPFIPVCAHWIAECWSLHYIEVIELLSVFTKLLDSLNTHVTVLFISRFSVLFRCVYFVVDRFGRTKREYYKIK